MLYLDHAMHRRHLAQAEQHVPQCKRHIAEHEERGCECLKAQDPILARRLFECFHTIELEHIRRRRAIQELDR